MQLLRVHAKAKHLKDWAVPADPKRRGLPILLTKLYGYHKVILNTEEKGLSMTLATAPLEVEIVLESDLDSAAATAITGRIRAWAAAFPAEDVKRAFLGRVWLAMGYVSWVEWCDRELNGFQLPVAERRAVVTELHGAGMSNRAIAEVVGADRQTVANDLKATGENSPVDPERKTFGQDGKARRQPTPQPEPEYVPQPSGPIPGGGGQDNRTKHPSGMPKAKPASPAQKAKLAAIELQKAIENVQKLVEHHPGHPALADWLRAPVLYAESACADILATFE